jgi:CubicO group peptidase (beta-lactamase class C family)
MVYASNKHFLRLVLASACLVAFAHAPLSQAAAPSIDDAALNELVKRAGELDTDALVVLHDGKLVLERWFDGKPRRIESMSVTKSVVAMAFGRLLTLGKLKSLDEPVSAWYPEWKQGRKRSITLRHLLTQTSGLQGDPMTGSEIYGSPDFVQLALCAELSDEPGKKFFYNNKATNLLAGLVQKISGQPLDLFMRKEVFEPLGITDVVWLKDPAGNPQGMSGLQLRPGDLAKLGQLMLDEGRWNGKPLLSAEWVREATAEGEVNKWYGQLWWLIRDLTLTIDDDLLEQWRRGGADPQFIAAMATLKGRVMGDDFNPSIREALKDLGGEETWVKNTYKRGLPDGKLLSARVVGFRADGWQGQQVIVLKQERLVVVRMREASQGNTPEENKRFGFGELPRLARRLVLRAESAEHTKVAAPK